MKVEPVHVIKDCSLYCGDMLELLPRIAREVRIDAIVTDPPYGIGADVIQKKRARKKYGLSWAPCKDYGTSNWDHSPCSPEMISLMQEISDYQIIFGGNYFRLPPSSCWLVWDKMNGSNNYADCELAWTNLKKAVRRLQLRWHGMIRDENEERVHPTQKPVGVMKWCLSHLPKECEVICDPFLGSGSTGVACVRARKKFIGIDQDPKYVEMAAERIRKIAWVPHPDPKKREGFEAYWNE